MYNGTVFYRDRTDAENQSTQRAALGGDVWRQTDGSDALFEECVGPSTYAKAQGDPIRIWGMLADDKLFFHILPKGWSMNRWYYRWLIANKFPQWRGNCKYIVQDFEACLRCAEPLEAMASIGMSLVEGHPKYSQDLNAIENAWKLLRDRMAETLPSHLESRDDSWRHIIMHLLCCLGGSGDGRTGFLVIRIHVFRKLIPGRLSA